eukprot:TRINITY_DN5732_c0_g1_i7.p1 TRINITY_DN5732_c0_g1~~TRINITY_DN5732_c0_g1_i7.p1  ORF type:complete len:219 (-),score=23.38 TRINITY_DN5732_c0_g1_i7:93-749(-)
MGDVSTAQQHLNYAKQLIQTEFKCQQPIHPLYAQICSLQGLIFQFLLQETIEAQKHFSESLQIKEELYEDSDNFHLAATYLQYGRILVINKEQKQGLEYCKKGIKLTKKHFGKNSLHLATNYFKIAQVHSNMKNVKQALKYCDKSIRILKITFPSGNHPGIQRALQQKGVIYHNNANYDEAIEAYLESIKNTLENKILNQCIYFYWKHIYSSILLKLN